MKAELVLDCRNGLGESIVWDPRSREIRWVNIHEGEIWSHSPTSGSTRTQAMPERVGAIGLRRQGGLVVGLETGFALLDEETGALERLNVVEREFPDTRLNDGRCDRNGRFVCGSMNGAPKPEVLCGVYALDADRSVRQVISGITCANSTCFSLDGRTMYFSDMPTNTILAYDYDAEHGLPSNPRLFFDGKGCGGLPDGSTVDAEGYLWNARWGSAQIVRCAPDGRVERIVDLPVSNVSCVGFGGHDLETLYVTTARIELSPDQIVREPTAGSLYAIRAGVRGVPEPFYHG